MKVITYTVSVFNIKYVLQKRYTASGHTGDSADKYQVNLTTSDPFGREVSDKKTGLPHLR